MPRALDAALDQPEARSGDGALIAFERAPTTGLARFIYLEYRGDRWVVMGQEGMAS